MKIMDILIWFGVLILVLFVGYRLYKDGKVYQKSVTEQIDGKKTDTSAYVYENKYSGYKISIPKSWGVSEGGGDEYFESRVEMTPPAESDFRATKVSIDVLKKGAQIAALDSQEEFEKWDMKDTGFVENNMEKVGEDLVGGNKTLLLADKNLSDNWTLLGWFRKNGKNYYVRMEGKQNLEETDKQTFRYMLGTMEIK